MNDLRTLPEKIRNNNFLETGNEINRIIQQSTNGKIDKKETTQNLNNSYLGTTLVLEHIKSFFDPTLNETTGNENGFGLVEKKGDDLYLRNVRPVQFRFTKREANAIHMILTNGALDLFVSQKAKEILKKNLALYRAKTNAQFYDYHQYIRFVSLPNLGDDCTEAQLVDNFKCIAKAIEEKSNISYYYKDNTKGYEVTPIHFIMSPLTKRIYMEGITPEGIRVKVRIKFMVQIKMTLTKPFVDKDKPKAKLLKLKTDRSFNALERIVAKFNDYQRKIIFLPDEEKYSLEITYDSSEEEAVRIRLLSLGDKITIVSKEHKEVVQEEAKKALARYGNATNENNS